ncbi:MAG: hypothetical protein HXY37_11980 [Chloroflexi bacterium]|nr:hypothetical protein [Chloroflexota bacterium]
MADSTKRTVRKGRVYPMKVADVEYRAFIWQSGSGFCGRLEDQPQVALCRGRTVVAVRNQLSAALLALQAQDLK